MIRLLLLLILFNCLSCSSGNSEDEFDGWQSVRPGHEYANYRSLFQIIESSDGRLQAEKAKILRRIYKDITPLNEDLELVHSITRNKKTFIYLHFKDKVFVLTYEAHQEGQRVKILKKVIQ